MHWAPTMGSWIQCVLVMWRSVSAGHIRHVSMCVHLLAVDHSPAVMEMMPTILTCFQGGCYTKYTRSRCHNMRACETFLAKSQCRSGRFLKGTIAFNFFPKSPLIMFFFCTTGNCNLVFHDHFHPLFEPYLNDFWQIMWHEDWSNDAENWALPSQE